MAVAFKMRGLVLLCLVGLVLTASLYQGDTTASPKVSPLSRRPFDTANGTNSSEVDADSPGKVKLVIPNAGSENVVQWNGTIRAIESDYGFPPGESEEEVVNKPQ